MAKRILVVDDSASMRQIIRFTLETAGHEVVESTDGQEALKALADSAFHMILTDLNMPNLDGLSLIRAVRSDTPHRFVPIVMLTTEFHESKKQAARSAGATGWIVKPFRPEQLLAVVNRVIG